MKISTAFKTALITGVLMNFCTLMAQVGFQNIKLCVISDVHYFDTSLLISDGPAFEEYLNSDRKLLRESYAITESLIDSLISEQPDIVLVSGDITKDGESVCHQKMADYFSELEAAGSQVFVCPGNHDINNPMAVAFDGDYTIPVPTVNPVQFKTLYSDYGFLEAIATDTASLSYVAEPIQGLQILSMDVCRYDSNFINNYPQTSGGFKPQVLDWIKDRIVDACGQGKIIIGLMHHNFVEHFTNQKMIFTEYVVDDWENVSSQLSDLGMKIVFTGHFHAQDIVSYLTGSGKSILDVETGSVVTWPSPYRICTLGTDSVLTLTGKRIENINFDTGGVPFQEYALNDLETGLPPIIISLLMGPPYNLSQGVAEYIEPAFTETMIAHYNGNEGDPSSNTQWIMFWMWLFGYDYIADAMDGVWNDATPDDWNTTIDLSPTETRLMLDLTAFLEGPFDGSEMATDLNPGYLPLIQPYSGEPWAYSGSKDIGSIPNTEVVDWILVEIRDAASAGQATGATVSGRQCAFLLNNGSVVALDGTSHLRFFHTVGQQLFAVIHHRNHLGIMSGNPLTLTGGIYHYNFSSNSAQVYGGAAGTKEIANGIWGMIAGDGDAGGIVDMEDKNPVWNSQSGFPGYLSGDYNMDGNTNNADKNDKWLSNLNSSSQVPD
jgi:3',5'-cyclic AMP phosphodiesterase CpdA